MAVGKVASFSQGQSHLSEDFYLWGGCDYYVGHSVTAAIAFGDLTGRTGGWFLCVCFGLGFFLFLFVAVVVVLFLMGPLETAIFARKGSLSKYAYLVLSYINVLYWKYFMLS